MTDERILKLLWQRSEDAIRALAARFGQRLHATAMHILGSRRDAEESVSDTYLAVWNAVPPKKPDPLSGFVYKTGRNLALKKYRDTTAQKRDGSYDLSLEELEGCIPARALDEMVEARALGADIDRFLGTVSRENRTIFLRRYWFGDSVKEIAGALGLSENTVSARLSRTRSALRKYLIKEGYLDE